MARRKTVKINIDFVLPLIKKVCRSNVVFCEKMGRSSGQWVSDWQRKDENGNPSPRNLPSPEEAARMCVLLQTTPEEILLEPEDIALVNDLLEQEKGAKKAPGQEAEGEIGELNAEEKELILVWRKMNQGDRARQLDYLLFLAKGPKDK